MDFVLDNNTFRFGNQNYTQKQGTAIGSKLGCNYACTYMGEWEKILLECQPSPAFFVRYIDDIFGVWLEGEHSLQNFHSLANKITPHIQVDLRVSRREIEFFDVIVEISNNSISTRIFSNRTDKHIYLHNSSNHPRHMKRSIPYGLAMRAKQICSRQQDYKEEEDKIVKRMTSRGHGHASCKLQVDRVDDISRESLLQYREKTQQKGVMPFSSECWEHFTES